jgi:putative endonuclease
MHIKSDKNSFYVYIVTDEQRTGLLPGATGDLAHRMARLTNKTNIPETTAESPYTSLIYWEVLDNPLQAVQRKEEIEGWSRRRKEALIGQQNPEWKTLNEELHKVSARINEGD